MRTPDIEEVTPHGFHVGVLWDALLPVVGVAFLSVLEFAMLLHVMGKHEEDGRREEAVEVQLPLFAIA